MEQFKEKLKTIINKIKGVFKESIKDSKLMDAIFISFVFVMLGLSIMGICIAMFSNRYDSVVFDGKNPNGNNKEVSNLESFLKRDDKEVGNENIEQPITNVPTSSEENPIEPGEMLTIVCTSTFKSDIEKEGIVYPTNMIEQIVAKFDSETKEFYQADVSIALYYRNNNVDDLEKLQIAYEEKLNRYVSYFEIGNTDVIFSSPTQAYINLKNLDYETYHLGYQKETETYDSFLYTFKTGGYVCKV